MTMMADRDNAARDIAAELVVSLSTLYAYVDARGRRAHARPNCSASVLPSPCRLRNSPERCTIYMDAAARPAPRPGTRGPARRRRRLSPLGFKHVNMLGRYAFTLPDTVARGELRPLRDPRVAGIDEA